MIKDNTLFPNVQIKEVNLTHLIPIICGDIKNIFGNYTLYVTI